MELKELIKKYELEIVELTKIQKHPSNNSIDMISWFNARIETISEILIDLKQLSIASSDRSALKELIDFVKEASRMHCDDDMPDIRDKANKLLKSINIGEQGD